MHVNVVTSAIQAVLARIEAERLLVRAIAADIPEAIGWESKPWTADMEAQTARIQEWYANLSDAEREDIEELWDGFHGGPRSEDYDALAELDGMAEGVRVLALAIRDRIGVAQ